MLTSLFYPWKDVLSLVTRYVNHAAILSVFCCDRILIAALNVDRVLTREILFLSGYLPSRVSLWAMFTLQHRRQALNRRVNEVIQYLTALHNILLMFLCATRFCDNLCLSLSMISRYRCKLLVRVPRWTCQCYLCKRTLINILGSVRFHHELEVEHWMN